MPHPVVRKVQRIIEVDGGGQVPLAVGQGIGAVEWHSRGFAQQKIARVEDAVVVLVGIDPHEGIGFGQAEESRVRIVGDSIDEGRRIAGHAAIGDIGRIQAGAGLARYTEDCRRWRGVNEAESRYRIPTGQAIEWEEIGGS